MIGTKEKVPSEIAYLPNGDIKWGSLIAPHVWRYQWTKLELDPRRTGFGDGEVGEDGDAVGDDDDGTEMQQGIALVPTGSARQPVDIIADYLKQVKAHLLKALDAQYGKELWRTLPITLVVTVPAVWSDAAKDRTLQAVSKAGFNQSELPQLKQTLTTTEPEAAAIYTIKQLQGSVQAAQLNIGDGFVICDLGGGTVDLISYKVAGLEPTLVEEATVGTGDHCGGSFVDRSFLLWLEKRIGAHTFMTIAGCRAQDISHVALPPKIGRMLQEFTLSAKSGFSGSELYWLRLPAPLSAIEDPERGMCDGELLIEAADMMEMFEFSVPRTLRLLSEQLQDARRTGNANIKYIFTVGGFAESPYMFNRIAEFATSQGYIAVKPAYAWSAVVRGACTKGLERRIAPTASSPPTTSSTVLNRKSRRHYGTVCNRKFVAGKHRLAESYMCPYTGTWRADQQADWLIHQGQVLSTAPGSVHGKITFFYSFWEDHKRVVTVPLLASDRVSAPTRARDQHVYKVAELRIDLTCVPKDMFVAQRSPQGKPYHTLSYEVEIVVSSVLEFSLTVNEKRYGSVTAKYM
ncbi:Hsp70 family protein [Massariosphaeria phaeospora]|uniref:Hsp70 family protein n=1 Tax=Massariosphaeria phaeospora TaxID=100035 RepID=A0A7C8I059_9PLEO|nr:Hsp70 family protein [Massariosphaeria phaeospora]